MKTMMIPFYSGATIDDHRPWYDMSVEERSDNVVLTIADGSRRGEPTPLKGRRLEVSKAVDELMRIVITLDDEFAAVPDSKYAGEYHIYLGEYDPVTDTLMLLDFIDDTPPPPPLAEGVERNVAEAIAAIQSGRQVNASQFRVTDDELSRLIQLYGVPTRSAETSESSTVDAVTSPTDDALASSR